MWRSRQTKSTCLPYNRQYLEHGLIALLMKVSFIRANAGPGLPADQRLDTTLTLTWLNMIRQTFWTNFALSTVTPKRKCRHLGDISIIGYTGSYFDNFRYSTQRKFCENDDHYIDVMMSAMASQITSFTIVHSTVASGAYQRKHQSYAALAFGRGIHTQGQ